MIRDIVFGKLQFGEAVRINGPVDLDQIDCLPQKLDLAVFCFQPPEDELMDQAAGFC